MQRTKKQPKNTIAKVWEEIEIEFKCNPVPIPNRTLLRWVEMYCPNSFVKISDTIENSKTYDADKDIYHQEFSLILITVNQFIQENGFNSKFAFMSIDMQMVLLKIEPTLKLTPLHAKNDETN